VIMGVATLDDRMTCACCRDPHDAAPDARPQ
jgi:hypothetical protein